MSDINSFTCVGNLTRDSALKTVGAKGSTLLEFSIANNTGFGQYACTQFFKVNLWGQRASALAQYLSKGTKVCVVGTLENKAWTDDGGVKHDSWVITASDVALLSRPREPAQALPENDYDEGEAVF